MRRFPGAPNFERYDSLRPLYSGTLRSTLSSNMVNELRGGIDARAARRISADLATPRCETFDGQGGYAIDFDANIGLTNWHTSNAVSWRSAWTYCSKTR